jgi:hypothetical protein
LHPPTSQPEDDGQPLSVAVVKGAISQHREMFRKQCKDGGGEEIQI